MSIRSVSDARKNRRKDPLMFDLILDEYEPPWSTKLLTVLLFGAAGAVCGALSSILPMVGLNLHNVVQAALAAMTAALPLARSFLIATRGREHWRITGLSVLLCGLGYLAFAAWLYVLPSKTDFEGTTEGTWEMAAFLVWIIFLLTWKFYLPAAVICGHVNAVFLRRFLPNAFPAFRKEPRSGV